MKQQNLDSITCVMVLIMLFFVTVTNSWADPATHYPTSKEKISMTSDVNISVKQTDLKVVGIYILPQVPKVGDDIEISAYIKNGGEAFSKECNAKMTVILEGNVIDETNFIIPRIQPGDNLNPYVHRVKKKAVQHGTYKITVEVDTAADRINTNEITLANNTRTKSFLLVSKLPDLKITKISCPDKERHVGRKFTILVNVKNIGEADAVGPVWVNLQRPKDMVPGIAYGNKWKTERLSVPYIHVDETKQFKFTFRYYNNRGWKNVFAQVNPKNLPVESNLDNNTKSQLAIRVK
jgi:subtilase family serine protease